MGKSPSATSLLFLALFVAATIVSGRISWANLLQQSKEYQFKADRLQSEGKLQQAIEYYQKAVGLDKYCLAAYNGLGMCYEQQGLFSRAEEWYLKALEINPEYAPAHYNLGLLYEKSGEIKKALFHWRRRLSLGSPGEPGQIKARAKLARYGPDELKEEEATQLAQHIVEKKQSSALDKVLGRDKYKTKEEWLNTYYLQGMQSYQQGDYQGAAEYFHKMIEVLPISN